MALSLNSVFEVRGASGNDTNGGGFVTGASGTDFSQQGAKNSGSTNKSVTDGVTAGSTTVTSATANFQTSIIGNIIYIAGGTGSITGGWYQVTARGSSSSITVDRATGLTAGTGVTLNIGGALATIQAALTLMTVTGMTAYVLADGTYSISTGLTVATAGGTTHRTRVSGYTTTRNDSGRVTVQATAAITMLTQSLIDWTWENFIFDGNGTGTNGVNHSAGGGSGFGNYINLVLKNFTGYGFNASANSSTQQIIMDNVEVTGCAGTAGINLVQSFLNMTRCYVHDNTVSGLVTTTTGDGINLTDCIFANNSGATSDGVNCGTRPLGMVGCVFYNNGRDGLRITDALQAFGLIANNIFVNNAGTGLNLTNSDAWMGNTITNNAFYGNGTASAGCTPVNSVTLSGDPFTNGTGGDFTLNSNSGQGSACKGAGTPGTIPGTTGTGYEDIGVFQHPDPAGGGSLLVHPGMTGGMHG